MTAKEKHLCPGSKKTTKSKRSKHWPPEKAKVENTLTKFTKGHGLSGLCFNSLSAMNNLNGAVMINQVRP